VRRVRSVHLTPKVTDSLRYDVRDYQKERETLKNVIPQYRPLTHSFVLQITRLFEETRVALLVTLEVRSVKVQSSDRTLALERESLDRREVGVVLVACVLVSCETVTDDFTVWLSEFPNFGGGFDVVLVHGSSDTGSNGSSEKGSSGSREESLARLLSLGVQCNDAALGSRDRGERRSGGKSGEGNNSGELHCV